MIPQQCEQVVNDTTQGIKSRNRKRTLSGKWKTNGEQEVRMLLPSLETSTKATSFRACLGAGYPCGTSLRRARVKNKALNAALVRTQFTPPLRAPEEAAGEVPRCESVSQ